MKQESSHRGLAALAAFIVLGAALPATAAWWRSDRSSTPTGAAFLSAKPDEWKVLGGGLVADGANPALRLDARPGPALLLESKAVSSGDCELTATVKLDTRLAHASQASFWLGRKSNEQPGVLVRVTATKGNDYVICGVFRGDGQPLHDMKALAAELPWTPQVPTSMVYQPKAYTQFLPGWPDELRAGIEYDMSRLPARDEMTYAVRMTVRRGHLRVWFEDRLVARQDLPTIDGSGPARIELLPTTQLLSYNVRLLPPSTNEAYLPLPVGGALNGRALLDGKGVEAGSLPPAGQTVQVAGVPFVFPGVNGEGNDHLDISQSLFRQCNTTDYLGTSGPRWGGTRLRDPARVQMRFENGQYDTLYVVAASDGKTDSLPLFTAQFYRPEAGYAENFEARVPLATARARSATPLGVRLENGKAINLWLVKVALDPGKLSSLADLGIVELEFTKQVHLYRSWPDPYTYDFHAGGQPSGVHIYAATLGRVPVGFGFEPDKFGHVWTAPEVPGYTATLTNNTGKAQRGQIKITTRSYDGTEVSARQQDVAVAAGAIEKVALTAVVKLNGYHDIVATLTIAGKTWTEQRSLVRLAPDTRAVKWEDGKGALFGYWSFHGGHHTPDGDLIRTVMTAAGARASIHGSTPEPDEPAMKHWSPTPSGAWSVAPQAWAVQQPVDPEKRAAFKAQVIKNYSEEWAKVPEQLRPDFVAFFPEPHISLRLTTGNYPSYWGEPDFEWSDYERERVKMFRATAEIAAEAVHEKWPGLKILIPWGDPLFTVPLLRDGISKDVINGTAVDIPGFERMPEMQLHQLTPHRLYVLKNEFKKAGMPEPVLHYVEGICVPTHAGALSWREQMDVYNRWNLLSMAYGVKRFYAGWNAYDLASYYGAEHYGCVGIQRRIPYCDPKPGYAAFATMTDKLDRANFEGWLPTGSLSTYCLRFKGPKGPVYALWTLRGKRPVTLTVSSGKVQVTDVMNNSQTPAGTTAVTVTTSPSVTYITGAEISSVAVGMPDNSDAAQTVGAMPIGDLGDGSWRLTDDRDEGYEESNFGVRRYRGEFSSAIATDAVHGKVLQTTLEKQAKVHELMPWYRNLAPQKPILLQGAPSHLGLWVKGNSDWGRVVYTVRDADGEKWISVGQKDDWNNDDTHSWSSFNFDGWRYLRFELPGDLGYDTFRKHGTTWWGSYGGGSTADRGNITLPLTLESIKIEQRSHAIYVNDVQPVASNKVQFGKLFVEYAAPADATPEAIRLSRLRMPLPPAPANLPNPIVEMTQNGVGEPTRITKLTPPEHEYDGTRTLVAFDEVPGAKAYYVWVSTHADGRSAVNMTTSGLKNGGLVWGLRPGIDLYFWVVYLDANGKLSKPSPAHREKLVDAFAQK